MEDIITLPDIEIIIRGEERSGKTTIQNVIAKHLHELGMKTIRIDGYSPPQLMNKISDEEIKQLQPKMVVITTENKKLNEVSMFYPNI